MELRFFVKAVAGLWKEIDLLAVYPYLFLLGFFVVAFIAVLGMNNSYEKMQKFVPSIRKSLLTVFLMIWCICSFSGISTFLYFNF